MRELVLVLNFDPVASRTVARTLRAERIDCKILPGDTSAQDVFAYQPMGVILSGGAGKGVPFDSALLEQDTPVLALGGMACALNEALGGQTGEQEIFNELCSIHFQQSPLFDNMDDTEHMVQCGFRMHLSDVCQGIMQAEGMTIGFAHMLRPFYGLQLYIEPNAPEDSEILRNFAVQVCHCARTWSEEAFIEAAADGIRAAVGEQRALCCVTGGLDSALSAVIARKALGDQLQCVFVDAGFLREGEAGTFLTLCEEKLGLPVHAVEEKERFMAALQGISDRDEKRLAFQNTMHQVLTEQAEKLGDFGFFIKGTNCGDQLFSVCPASEQLAPAGLQVLEPLQDLFKQEIRLVGLAAGMPREMTDQQPFPSGGLAQRIVGEVDGEKLNVLRFADHVFAAELRSSGAARRLFQYYALMLPPRDSQSGATIVLRAAQSGEGPVSSAARLPYDVTETVVDTILRHCRQVAHVVYDMTPGNYYTEIEW